MKGRKPMKQKCMKRICNKTVRKAILEVYIKHRNAPTMEGIIDAMEEYCGMNRIEYGRIEDPFEYD
jgi:hypothetical protein